MNDQQSKSLIKMINQISVNNDHYGDQEQAAELVAIHIKKYWARSMKHQISEYVISGGENLSPISLKAVKKLL